VITALSLSAPLGCKEKPQNKTKENSDNDKTLKLSGEELKNAQLEVVEAKGDDVQPTFEYSGDIRLPPDAHAKVVSKVKGVIQSLNAKPGDRVEKGKPLATIESRELSDAAIAYLEAAKKSHYARTSYEREKKLWEKKISAKESYLQKKEEYSQAIIAYDKSVQRLKTLGIKPKEIRSRRSDKNKTLSSYTVSSPISGTVINRPVAAGEAVQHESVLYEVAALGEVHVEFPLPAKHLAHIKIGAKATISSENLKRKTQGTLVFVAPTVDEKTRTTKGRVAIKSEDGVWKPGLCAQVTLKGAPVNAKVTVPREALTEIEGKPSVFVQLSKGVFDVRVVEKGAGDDVRFQILSGLKAGEKVVIKNTLTLKSAWEQRGD